MRSPLSSDQVVIEICVEDVAGVGISRDNGADRVEYCRDIACGGLTPDPATLGDALTLSPGDGIQLLVRCREGDFVYSQAEVTEMCTDISSARAAYDTWLTRHRPATPPTLGFVVGALTPDLTVDREACARFAEAAGPHSLTFHRAFDSVPDQPAALETLIAQGFVRVLTAGGSTLVADLDGLALLNRQAAARITILASGGLRSGNVANALTQTRITEVHMRAPHQATGRTDPAEVARIVRAIRRLPASS